MLTLAKAAEKEKCWRANELCSKRRRGHLVAGMPSFVSGHGGDKGAWWGLRLPWHRPLHQPKVAQDLPGSSSLLHLTSEGRSHQPRLTYTEENKSPIAEGKLVAEEQGQA